MSCLPYPEVVSYEAAIAYKSASQELLHDLNEEMHRLNKENDLIGHNLDQMMVENHENHCEFMVNVFLLQDYEMLDNTLYWVLSSYMAKGFKMSYFLTELEVWKRVINKHIEVIWARQILGVYDWMIEVLPMIDTQLQEHPRMIEFPYDQQWETIKNDFLEILLNSDMRGALKFAGRHINSVQSLRSFYTKVITYALYEVGVLWENGTISVATEHLITSIVIRIMADLYLKFDIIEQEKGTVIVTASANEYHEVGARILADILELDGWNALYLGANVPTADLLLEISKSQPVFVAVSVTMSSNIEDAMTIVSQIRSDQSLDNVRIMLGGLAFSYSSQEENKVIGADCIIKDVDKAIAVAKEWWKEYNDKLQ